WYIRESFASVEDDVVIVRFTAQGGGKINTALTLRRQQDADVMPHPTDATSLLLKGRLPIKDNWGNPRGLRFAAQVKAVATGGSVALHDHTLVVEEADTLTLYIAGATNHPGLSNLDETVFDFPGRPEHACQTAIAQAMRRRYDVAKATHIHEHQAYYNRMQLTLGAPNERLLPLTTNELLEEARQTGTPHPQLVETFFQYGRYLLISSS